MTVHSVGRDRWVHYYAVQLVEGVSLADLIRQVRVQRQAENGAASKSITTPHVAAADTQPIAPITTGLSLKSSSIFCAGARWRIQAFVPWLAILAAIRRGGLPSRSAANGDVAAIGIGRYGDGRNHHCLCKPIFT